MEDADVKQLISLIESAQLQYEVDETGAVSIVYDPVQLVGSSEEIGGTVLTANEVSSTAGILTQNLEATLVSEQDGKEVTDIIGISSAVKSEESSGADEDNNSEKVDDEKNDLTLEEVGTCQEEGSQQEAGPQLQLSSSGHYFIRTPDGQIIQVLGPLDEGVDEGPVLEEVQTGEGVGSETQSPVEGNDGEVQIFVVGGDSNEDVYLINAPDRNINGDGTRSPVSLSSVVLKSSSLLEATQEPTEISEQTCLVPSVSSSDIVKSSSSHEEEDTLTLCQQEDNTCLDNLLKDPDKIVLLEAAKGTTKYVPMSDTVPLSSSTKALPKNKHYIRLNPKTKPKTKIPVKTQIHPARPLGEGAIVQTDRGAMVAHNLSSVVQVKPSIPKGQKKTTMQYIASRFGAVVKVLRPVDEKKESEVSTIDERLAVWTCEECGAFLHSKRSLENHRRRYHKEWNEECFVCGAKFLNMQYLRSHIQEAHGKEESFQCRLCSYKCTVLREFLRHRKVHDKSKICDKCGKKYIASRNFREHVQSCKVKRKVESKRKSNCLSSSVNEREPDKEKGKWPDVDDDNDMDYRKRRRKIRKIDNSTGLGDKMEDGGSTSLNTIHNRKKSTRNAVDELNLKNDGEFKIKSKHYCNQIQKITTEQNLQRMNRQGRDRTHRCYLCFKLFSTAADLDAHKEGYHLAKSDRPVRVKTDSTLDEEDIVDSAFTVNDDSVLDGTCEGVQVKQEPMGMGEEFDNITIVVDESMNSPYIIKPLCIACKAPTNVDFRQTSKWFNKIPDGDQSEALQKFQQFFPCVIDPKALIEPWVLCKKCVLLIDKIADMEDKLKSMKCDLMSRFKGQSDNECDVEDELNVNQNINPSKVHPPEGGTGGGVPVMNKFEMAEDIGKSLADIEAYMKETCEIMEITKPQKRPGRPRKQEKEKLTPVLVSDDDDEKSCMLDMVKYLSKGIVKTEKDTVIIDNCDNNDLDSMVITGDVKEVYSNNVEVGEESIEIQKQTHIKEEPLENSLESVILNPESLSWNEMTNHSLVSLTSLQEEDQFLVKNTDLRQGDELTQESETFSAEVMVEKPDETSDSTHDEDPLKCQTQFLQDYDPEADSMCEVNDIVTTKRSPTPSCSAVQMMSVDGEETILVQDGLMEVEEKCDMPLVFESKDENNKFLMENQQEKHKEKVLSKFIPVDGLEEGAVNTDKQKKQDTTTEDGCTDTHKLLTQKHKVLGKKRSQLREEREKMCFRRDEDTNKPWICSECNKGFSSQRGACDHYAASHKGQSFSCEHCTASYVRKRDLIGHYNKVHLNIKPYKCKVLDCVENFSSHGDLYRHLQSVHSIRKADTTPFSCHLCCATFAKKRYRDAHIPICVNKGSNSVPHKCPLCEKTFKLSNYLQIHMRTIHSWKTEQFFCEICNKLLTDKRNLILHMKSHMGETKTSCGVCGKQFNRKSYLWTHMRVHTNQRPYGCNFCPKWFKQYSTWKNHERTHTGEKPYKCSICKASFSTSSSVAKHVQYAHYNIRDYSCDICNKTFISRPKLVEHTKVHTGEKPYECHICKRAFNKKNNLRTHMYVHSTNKRYKCELCGEGFMRRAAIENHIMDCHELEFLLSSGSVSTNAEKDGDGGERRTVSISTTPFISIVGTEDITTEDSYIVIYADEDEELDNSAEMQVTVLAEDGTSSQVGLTSKHIAQTVGCSEVITSVESTPDILPEVILEDGPSGKRSEAITTLISEDVVSSITMQENSDSNITQVMEIDSAHFRLVTTEDATEPIYT
ncbi:uncharacterized protein LOC121862909 [Homarus americanus]|uniref:uncharacterized protein LOC121862909 n=1 Tax=Homarus americanus TaxID=6706 RepID=UPI001C46822E|nr:uncharacterized protein LOC121862909 [Homarus americanus]